MRPVTRLHFEGHVGTVQFAEVGVEDRSQAGSTWVISGQRLASADAAATALPNVNNCRAAWLGM